MVGGGGVLDFNLILAVGGGWAWCGHGVVVGDRGVTRSCCGVVLDVSGGWWVAAAAAVFLTSA